MRALSLYGLSSSQKVNFDKTKVFFSRGVSSPQRDVFYHAFPWSSASGYL